MTVTAFGGANIDALAAARTHVRERMKTREGTRCPCCEQFCKVYRRKISSPMARWLIHAVFLWKKNEVSLHAGDDWSVAILKGSGDFAKLRFWGLIEPLHGNRWYPTALGTDFVQDRVTVPEVALVFNDACLGFDGARVRIRDALGSRFNYDEIMAATP